ncbi:hypothetical protein GDO81_003943 [Engystomops pustulosus]|uniref:Uncharacterized protein n=1 Tax=Engystomops pustulosus TaxID=76066 RepID=A0AAV7A0T2_ENGPU|nr:hypothetical protein GDO81_003943 [Engystomops pustulosus]
MRSYIPGGNQRIPVSVCGTERPPGGEGRGSPGEGGRRLEAASGTWGKSRLCVDRREGSAAPPLSPQ